MHRLDAEIESILRNTSSVYIVADWLGRKRDHTQVALLARQMENDGITQIYGCLIARVAVKELQSSWSEGCQTNYHYQTHQAASGLSRYSHHSLLKPPYYRSSKIRCRKKELAALDTALETSKNFGKLGSWSSNPTE